MLFEKNYKTLCERGKTRKGQWKPGSGLERHRILPEHQGGIYVDSNCTYLTLREHAIAHYLLWRINGNVGDQLASRWMRNLKPELSIAPWDKTLRKIQGENVTETKR